MENPSESHFGKSFATFASLLVPSLYLCQEFWSQGAMLKEMLLCHTAVGRNAIEIAVGEQALSQRREADEANAVGMAIVEDAFFDRFAIDEVDATLID